MGFAHRHRHHGHHGHGRHGHGHHGWGYERGQSWFHEEDHECHTGGYGPDCGQHEGRGRRFAAGRGHRGGSSGGCHGHGHGGHGGHGFGGHGFGGGRGGRGGPPPWLKELFGGGRRRAERGEVRYLILAALEEQARHGYEIISEIETRTQGAYRPSPGTVYPTLQMLEELGLVEASEREGRKVYAITEAGKSELEVHRDEVEDAYDRLGYQDEWSEMADMAALVSRVPRLLRSIGRTLRRKTRTPARIAELEKLLDRFIAELDGLSGRGSKRSDS